MSTPNYTCQHCGKVVPYNEPPSPTINAVPTGFHVHGCSDTKEIKDGYLAGMNYEEPINRRNETAK